MGKYAEKANRSKAKQDALLSEPLKNEKSEVGEAKTSENVSAETAKKMGRPHNVQERSAFTTRVRTDVKQKIKMEAARYDVKPSDVIDALVDQYLESLDWNKVGKARR